jgi:hypothetical protein
MQGGMEAGRKKRATSMSGAAPVRVKARGTRRTVHPTREYAYRFFTY